MDRRAWAVDRRAWAEGCGQRVVRECEPRVCTERGVDREGCGKSGVDRGVWTERSVGREECGQRGVWAERSVGRERCAQRGVCTEMGVDRALHVGSVCGCVVDARPVCVYKR